MEMIDDSRCAEDVVEEMICDDKKRRRKKEDELRDCWFRVLIEDITRKKIE